MLLSEAHVQTLKELPPEDSDCVVIFDAMHVIHKWSFRPGETFIDVQNRYLHSMTSNIPPNTTSIHFCCKRYDHIPSLKSSECERRSKPSLHKDYDIQGRIKVPAFKDFVSVDENKATLMCFLSNKWSSSESRNGVPLYLSGGFTDQTMTVCMADEVNPVPELSSTYEEADMRIAKHFQYSLCTLHAKCIIVHANDTDAIILCIYLCANYPILDINPFILVHQIAPI